MEFFIDMIPPTSTHQQRGCTFRNGKKVFYDRANGEAEAKLRAYLSHHIPEKPFEFAVRLEVKWCFPIKDIQADGVYVNSNAKYYW